MYEKDRKGDRRRVSRTCPFFATSQIRVRNRSFHPADPHVTRAGLPRNSERVSENVSHKPPSTCRGSSDPSIGHAECQQGPTTKRGPKDGLRLTAVDPGERPCPQRCSLLPYPPMKDLLRLLAHLLTTGARLLKPGSARAVVAENVTVKQQLLVVHPSRRRNCPLSTGFCLVFGGLTSRNRPKEKPRFPPDAPQQHCDGRMRDAAPRSDTRKRDREAL